MKIAIIGSGAIGSLVAGYLKLKSEDVFLVSRMNSVALIREKGLKVSGVRGESNIKIDVSDRLKERPDAAILAVKTQDIPQALKDNLAFLKDTTILTTQNGIQADDLVAEYIPQDKIISSIVMFGATYLHPAEVVHNFEGGWMMGKIFSHNDDSVLNLKSVLHKIFPVTITDEIKGMKYLKIFLNANNCIPAILGLSMQEAFLDLDIAGISIAIWKEGSEIISRAGIELAALPDFPLERLTKLTGMPTQEAAKIFSGIMLSLSKEPLYGSILQSIKRDRPSEIDYLNGEFVRIASGNNSKAPLNEKLVEMVHQVEKTKKFFSKEELIQATKPLFN